MAVWRKVTAMPAGLDGYSVRLARRHNDDTAKPMRRTGGNNSSRINGEFYLLRPLLVNHRYCLLRWNRKLSTLVAI